jgi:glutamate racemase
MTDTRAIGVFDSGVGGLTVLRALKARWPAENFIYLADTARLPYGSKSLHTISQYVEQNIAFLRRYDLKAVVVACNSASTALLERPLQSDIPVFNVVEPGARKAVEASPSGRIGVLGTRATVHSEAYPRAIHKLLPTAEVSQQPCALFVPLVEEGWVDDPVTNLIVYRYVNALTRGQAPVDTLILGCTHYPVLRAAIAKAAGAVVHLVDSSQGLIEDLERARIPMTDGPRGRTTILCTDYSPRLEETIRLLLDGLHIDAIETVDI